MQKAGLKAPGVAARAILEAIGLRNGSVPEKTECGPGAPAPAAAGGAPAARSLGGGSGFHGCQIAGHVDVARVPGSITVSFDGVSRSLVHEAINTTHIVHSLFFGEPLTEYQSARLGAVAEEARRQSGSVYISTALYTAHHHYLSVVSRSIRFGTGHSVEAYAYTVHSDSSGEDGEGGAAVTWALELSPLGLAVTETRRPLYHFLVNVAGLLGGIGFLVGVFDQFLHSALRSRVVKDSLNKQR